MKIVVLDFRNRAVDILSMSDTSTEEEIEEYLSTEYGSLDYLEWMSAKDLKINIR